MVLGISVDDVESHRKAVLKNLKDAWSREGRINDKDSFVSYMQFIVSLLGSKNPKMKLPAEKIKALNKIVEDIGKNK